MRFLMDTHVLLWMAWNSPKLSKQTEEIVVDPSNDLHVSIVSLWEIGLKLNKGGFTETFTIEDILQYCSKQNLTIQPIAPEAITELSRLPHYPDHNDPFDRMIVCTAIVLGIPLLSSDFKLDRYNIKRIG